MILLITIGDVDRTILEDLRQPLTEVFRQNVLIGDGVELPQQTYNPQREQYLSTRILSGLPLPDSSDRVLGVSDVDLYAEGYDFVFGEAEFNGNRALISVTRLRQEYYGLPADEKLFQSRARKEAVHELGHTYHLRHCPHPVCVMHFSNSIGDTDIKDWNLCPVCRRQLKRRLVR